MTEESISSDVPSAGAGLHDVHMLPAIDTVRGTPKYAKSDLGRNGPCPCGSNKKFKQCCMGKTVTSKQGKYLLGFIVAFLIMAIILVIVQLFG